MFANEVASLQRLPMFRDVEVARLKLIALAGQRIHFALGDTIIRQGDRAQAVYVMMDGEAEIVRRVDGSTVRLATVGAGALVGEMGVILDQPYSGTILALGPVTALQIDAATFLELVNQVPQLSMALIRELSQRLLTTSELYAKALL
ncbi:MAG: cyclic nucleotide-binding domain-containing protein [Bosea sp. (in: a-proteobacteria)]